uniref:Large ribosomal subunit protein mL53 n=1 Tax=Cacopsylla melanoneura TaxID=428564 RepID=A0A8D8RYP2_9HEMI
MALVFSGSKTKSSGIIQAIIKQRKMLNLKPVKRIVFKFDPFDENCINVRRFMFHFNIRKVLKTNPICSVKTDVVCDRSEPVINVALTNGDSIQFKTSNLNELELFEMFNKHITSLVPKEDEDSKTEVKTKTATAGKDRKGKRK